MNIYELLIAAATPSVSNDVLPISVYVVLFNNPTKY
jgi:hypothetical protein